MSCLFIIVKLVPIGEVINLKKAVIALPNLKNKSKQNIEFKKFFY